MCTPSCILYLFYSLYDKTYYQANNDTWYMYVEKSTHCCDSAVISHIIVYVWVFYVVVFSEKGSIPQPILSKSRDAQATPVKYQESPVEEAQEALSLSAFGATSYPDGSSPFSGSGSSHKQAAALPPTLAPSKAPAVSLIQGERPAVAGGSPKIIPPASTERVRSLTNPSSDPETSNRSSASSIPFAYDTKAPAQVGINPVSASPCSGSMEKSATESASDQLRKLSSSWKDEASHHEKPGMEMRTMQHHTEMDDESCHDDRDDASQDSGSSVDGGSQRTRHGSGTVHTL